MTSLALLLIGFSVFSALTLGLTHFSTAHYPGQGLSRWMGIVLLLALVALQLTHFAWLYLDLPWMLAVPYRMALFAVAPAFFLFSEPLLRPPERPQLRPALLWHGVPVLLAPWIPFDRALPLVFLAGAGYLLWLARSLYALRNERERFPLELTLLGAVFAIAIAVSFLGFFEPLLPNKLFYKLYAIAIGGAFLLVQTALGLRPQLASDVTETAQATYASSTLTYVDCDAVLAQFDALMQVERLYLDPELNLPTLARRLGITSHQLSELMNTRLGSGFSRYLRALRINAAKAMLCEQPTASVLSVGLNNGFTSQSNFYEAFRELEGTTPGQYRKRHAK